MTLTTGLLGIGLFILAVFIFYKLIEYFYDKWYLKNLRKRKPVQTDGFF